MKVTSFNENDVVLSTSKNEKRCFKVAASAEFFNILSSNLYSNPVLSTCREILCNAWDAHIEKGIKKPIKVDFNGSVLTVRDFGNGIDPDKLGDIYCTYGASYKTDDAEQTGGFGLGCKSPFSVCDNFFVTTYQKGKEYKFSLVRSSLEHNGIPSYQKIFEKATDDPDGLKVEIPFRNPQDVLENCESLIRDGGINACLNEALINTLDFKGDFCVFYDKSRKDTQYIRYGNVLYYISKEKSELNKYLPSEYRGYKGLAIIFRAKEGEVDITPSREALQYSEKTIDFIKQCCKKLPKIDIFKELGFNKISDCYIVPTNISIKQNTSYTSNKDIAQAMFCNLTTTDISGMFKDLGAMYFDYFYNKAVTYFVNKNPNDILLQAFKKRSYPYMNAAMNRAKEALLACKGNAHLFYKNPRGKCIPVSRLNEEFQYILRKKIAFAQSASAVKEAKDIPIGTLVITGSKDAREEAAKKLIKEFDFSVINGFFKADTDSSSKEVRFINTSKYSIEPKNALCYLDSKDELTWYTLNKLLGGVSLPESRIIYLVNNKQRKEIQKYNLPNLYTYLKIELLKKCKEVGYLRRFRNSYTCIKKNFGEDIFYTFRDLANNKEFYRVYQVLEPNDSYVEDDYIYMSILTLVQRGINDPYFEKIITCKPSKKIIKLARKIMRFKKEAKLQKNRSFQNYMNAKFTVIKANI